ncbi:MAG: ARMT1-like domain-containing protein [Desulfohalobiaceae bacterium]
MRTLPAFNSALELQYRQDPYLDAWILHFMTENNLDHQLNPQINASPEQLRFMVAMQEGQVFVPCPDEELRQLFSPRVTSELQSAYNRQWRRLAGFVHENVQDRYLWRRIIALCRHKYRMVLASPFMIPSRLMKRFLDIFLTQTSLTDPMQETKALYNQRAHEFTHSALMQGLMDSCPQEAGSCGSMQNLRRVLDLEELRRLMCLATWKGIWENPASDLKLEAEAVLQSCCEATAVLEGALPARGSRGQGLKILFLPDQSGGIMLDLMIVDSLLRQGHQVVLALKEGFYFQAPTFWDSEQDQVLAHGLEGSRQIAQSRISKNELLQQLRKSSFLVISDGTRERLNLYRVSVTFARAWKESDLVLAKGLDHYKQLILNSHEFSRDILCFYRENGHLQLHFKAKSSLAVHYTEAQILAKAEEILQQMRQAKARGNKVMFYSAIIGSIPGQTSTAIRALNVYVDYLRQRLPKTLIINPAEYFEPGLDADDLMYMWERVQRSGLIDVWRFQSVQDIEKSFELLQEEMPTAWIGKDATFSTGCTKEMRIALEMQKVYPELQIIGPDPAKFFRRREYGIGKFFDAAISGENPGNSVGSKIGGR